MARGCDKVVALIGAPNVGKTTLFNAITGSSELVANWPGATVDVKMARVGIDGLNLCIVDLPGTYSVDGAGPEERVTRDFILNEKVDAVIVLVDSTNIERGLFLAIDVMELFDKVVVVLTKIDEAEARGYKIDVKELEKELGVPVIAVSALKGRGIRELIETVAKVALGEVKPRPRLGVVVAPEAAESHKKVTRILEGRGVSPRLAAWLAARLLEGSEWAWQLAGRLLGDVEEVRAIVEEESRRLREAGLDPVVAFASEKYRIASEIASRCIKGGRAELVELSRWDRVFLHPVLGPIASLGFMFLVFLATYVITTGSPLDIILDALGFHTAARLLESYNLMELVAHLMDAIASAVEHAIPNPVLARLVGEGVLSSSYGLGLVLTFMPLVVVLMAIIGALEDSGLVPRIAAGIDRFFRLFGVSGKAVFPAMISLGCNVPGVLAARVIDNPAERHAVIFAVPLIPCMARFTVLLAFAEVYFGGGLRGAVAVFFVYIVAVTAFLFTLRLASRRFGAEPEEIVLELPPVKRPSIKVVWWLTWDKIKHFLFRAGTVIVAFSIILWVLANFGPGGYLGPAAVTEKSYAVDMGKILAPYAEAVFGVNETIAWRIGFGLLGGFVAKEVFLDALAAVAPGSGGLEAYHLNPAQALSIMIAVTLYVPCVATLATMYAETRRLKLVAAALLYDFIAASVAALAVRLLATLL